MKNILPVFLFILMLAVIGCETKEDGVEPAQVTGKWQLMRAEGTNMIANSPAGPPSNLAYQEIIDFKADSTFIRTRSNGYVATGHYSLYFNSNEDYGVRLQFADPDLNYQEIASVPLTRQSSGYNGQLALRFLKSGELMEDHRSFDGHNFYYQQVKSNN